MPSPLPPAVLAALERRQTIEAIRRLRQATGLGLKEAKDVIDAHVRGLTPRPAPAPSRAEAKASPGLQSPGEVPKGGAAEWLVRLCLLALGAYVCYALLRH